ncbi:MAG TPA: hypothetical protein PLS69_10275, partial [Terricaulis sp.]|nr:hypothetical protein [Terricaulis sp.]
MSTMVRANKTSASAWRAMRAADAWVAWRWPSTTAWCAASASVTNSSQSAAPVARQALAIHAHRRRDDETPDRMLEQGFQQDGGADVVHLH